MELLPQYYKHFIHYYIFTSPVSKLTYHSSTYPLEGLQKKALKEKKAIKAGRCSPKRPPTRTLPHRVEIYLVPSWKERTFPGPAVHTTTTQAKTYQNCCWSRAKFCLSYTWGIVILEGKTDWHELQKLFKAVGGRGGGSCRGSAGRNS